jgi:hypothetical protein
MVAILAVTPDSVWMLEPYDGFNAADVILVTSTNQADRFLERPAIPGRAWVFCGSMPCHEIPYRQVDM